MSSAHAFRHKSFVRIQFFFRCLLFLLLTFHFSKFLSQTAITEDRINLWCPLVNNKGNRELKTLFGEQLLAPANNFRLLFIHELLKNSCSLKGEKKRKRNWLAVIGKLAQALAQTQTDPVNQSLNHDNPANRFDLFDDACEKFRCQ